jgi:hypothetical protein
MKVIVSPSLSKGYDRRYVVVDEATGEILDDAQGYGYRTAQNAHRAYSYKSMPPKQKSQPNAVERKVERWCAAHKEFMGHLEQAMFYAMKDGDSFTKADVEQLLSEHSLELPFPTQDLMRHW